MQRGSEGVVRSEPVDYLRALALQERLVAARWDGRIADTLWLLEHRPTVSYGTSGGHENIVLSKAALEARGVAVHETKRGGNVTFHNPGQLVGYPIVDLRDERDLHRYLRAVEAGLIAALCELGVAAATVEGRTGVWLDAGNDRARKIAAIGVRAQRWITSHGFALNIENALDAFSWIVPCGIADAGVTSLAVEMSGTLPPWPHLCAIVHRALETSLERRLEMVSTADIERLLGDRAR